MCAAVREASTWMVRLGFDAELVTKIDPSQM